MIHPTPRIWRRLACWIAFIATLVTYLLTLEPDASLWDCPEYLVTAAKLEIGHPPGNPVWTLTTRIFSIFGGADPQHIAIAVNISSAIFTAGAAAILSSVVFIMLRMVTRRRGGYALAAVSLAAGLTLGWCDSPWYSAVEAEVYAMSLFLTALSVRLMLGWALMRDPMRRGRQLLLIVYLTGLSIGVHQLNLLVIPALSMIWLFCSSRRTPGFWRIVLTLLISAGAVGVIPLGFMPGVIWLAGKCELLCVNRLGMPLHSGICIFWALSLGITLFAGISPRMARRRVSPGTQVAAWIPAMLLTGYAAYMLIPIRSAANPPMNEGDPSNIFSLAEYLNRDQYGKNPLLYGRTPHSRIMRQETIRPDGTPDYSQYARRVVSPRHLPAPDGGSYRHYDDHTELIYTPELNMWMPRMTSQNDADIASYADWAGMTPEDMQEVEISYALDSIGNPVGKLNADGSRTREKELRPTYIQQIRYLFGYQIGYMYLRYLLWNFSGRQNDRFASGEVEHGNFITGFPAVDDAMLGPQNEMPEEIGGNNPGHNVFFMIPLLIGIWGMIWLQRNGKRGRRANLVIAILFLMTGIAIVAYLNQSPREPRERDYSFLGSIWSYALWIGAGLWGIVVSASKGGRHMSDKTRRRMSRILATLTLLLPGWMLAVNFDDHDRSGRTVTSDYAENLLESLEQNAILFTNGDNFTFPLWWAQEVAGIRRDVTIVNTAYLATPWYICQLMTDRPGYEDHSPMPGLRMMMPDTLVRYGAFPATPYKRTPLIPSRSDTLASVDAADALRNLYASPSGYRMPAMLRLGVKRDDAASADSIWLRSSAVASGSGVISRRQLAAFDIIVSNLMSASPRPVYWLSSLSSGDFAGFYPLTARTLHTRRLIYADSISPAIAARLLDQDLKAARKSLSGRRGYFLGRGVGDGEEAHIYADHTVGSHITGQRLGMLRLAERLIDAGRQADALEVAMIVERNFPPDIWEYQICNESEGTLYEGLALGRILTRCASAAGSDSTSVRERGETLIEREQERRRQWLRYYRLLPGRLRPVLTPKHRQFISAKELDTPAGE